MQCRVSKLIIAVALAVGLGAPARAQETPMADAATAASDVNPALKALDDEKARIDKQTAVLESRQKLSEAQANAAKAALGPLGSYTGAKGDVTVDATNRSTLEATLLAAIAIDKAGDQIGLRLCRVVAARATPQATCPQPASAPAPAPPAPTTLPPVEQMSPSALCQEARTLAPPPLAGAALKPVIIVAQTTTSVTDLADAFLLRTTALGREFCAALATPARAAAEEVLGGSAAVAGEVIDIIGNLFRADYTLYGIALTADQTLLEKRVALGFMANGLGNPVFLPDLSPVSPLDASNPAVRRLAVLDALRGLAVANTNAAARARLDAAIKAYDDAVAALTTASDGKPPLLATIIRQTRTAELIRQGGYLVITNVHMMGGTSYTKKNFFTFLGGMPYFVSGGALVSYLVQDGLTGPALDTVTIPVTSGYHRANQIDRAFPGAANH